MRKPFILAVLLVAAGSVAGVAAQSNLASLFDRYDVKPNFGQTVRATRLGRLDHLGGRRRQGRGHRDGPRRAVFPCVYAGWQTGEDLGR